MKNEERNYCYGKEADRYQPPITGELDSEGREYYPYFVGDDLKEAVNLAIALDRPLLLEGAPGCGKTRLAGSIAYEFTQKYLKNEGRPDWWPYYIWNVKSIGRAQDGLYTFDAVGRLRDAQLVGMDPTKLEKILDGGERTGGEREFDRLKKRLQDVTQYRKFGPLGTALSQAVGDRPIVLIDEINKADSDFPLVSRIFRALDLRFLKPLHRAVRFLSSEPPRIIHDTNANPDSSRYFKTKTPSFAHCLRRSKSACFLARSSLFCFLR